MVRWSNFETSFQFTEIHSVLTGTAHTEKEDITYWLTGASAPEPCDNFLFFFAAERIQYRFVLLKHIQ